MADDSYVNPAAILPPGWQGNGNWSRPANNLRGFIKTGAASSLNATTSAVPFTQSNGQLVGESFVESGSVNSYQPRYAIESPYSIPYSAYGGMRAVNANRQKELAQVYGANSGQPVPGGKTLLGG